MVGNFLEAAVRRGETDLSVALVVVEEINAGVVGRPVRRQNVAIELVGDGTGASAVAVHDVELGGLMTLVAVVESSVGDPFAVGRNVRISVRPFAVSQSAQRAISNVEFVDLGVQIFVLGFGMAVGGDQKKFAIRGPCGACGAKFVTAIGKISIGYLARGAPFSGNDEHLDIAGLEIASAVETIDKTIVSGWRIRPFCATGRRG